MSGFTGPMSEWPKPTPAQLARLIEEYPQIREALRAAFERLAEMAPRMAALAEQVAVAAIPSPRDGGPKAGDR